MPTATIPLVGSFSQRGIDGDQAIQLAQDKRHCNKCLQWKMFKTGSKHAWCRDCKRAYHLSRYKKNREEILRKAKEYGTQNREILRARWRKYSSENREKINAQVRAVRQSNPELTKFKAAKWRDENRAHFRSIHKHHSAMRRGLIRSQKIARPYASEIRRFYMDCPVGFQVDHVVPIKGKKVCGLHVPWNLQYLPAAENRKKWNKHAEN